MIEVESLHFRHPSVSAPVLRGVDFKVATGEIVALLGPNGCGKTTLLRCLAGQLTPYSGTIRLNGGISASMSVRQRARLVATVPQDHGIPFAYSVAEVVLMGRTPHIGLLAVPGRQDRDKAAAALAQTEMTAFADKPFHCLSGGERQLVLVARALAQESPVLLFDEPTSHLDLRNQLRVLGQIRKIVPQRKSAVIMTLHDPNLALNFADRAMMLADGRIWSDGPPSEVISPAALAAVFGVDAEVVEFGGRHAVLARNAR